jgi:hypothetical protein
LTSISCPVETWRSFTIPLASSDSPKMAARGIPFFKQYCSCAANLVLHSDECSAYNDQRHLETVHCNGTSSSWNNHVFRLCPSSNVSKNTFQKLDVSFLR